MLNIFQRLNFNEVIFGAMIFAYILTCLAMSRFSKFLPKDIGREFALNGKLSKGKPRGAGLIFITVFALVSVVFLNIGMENFLYLVIVCLSMLTGFFDDASNKPWGEYFKGLLDLIIAIMAVSIYTFYHSATFTINLFNSSVMLNKYLFYVLAVLLIWGSINITNCSDGVDGLVGTISMITLLSFFFLYKNDSTFGGIILIMIMSILGYMWFNVSPSRLIMGDAGARGIGVFIAITALKSQLPLLFLPFAFIFILDGGSGLIKISLLRFLKIKILKNTRTPLHDHVRKVWNWSDTQTVMRFAIIQLLVSLIFLWMISNDIR